MQRKDVNFEGHGGTTLRGWLYLPDETKETVPGIVMAHGLTSTIHMGLADFAEVFANNGMAVLVYDHANFGLSDGEPRSVVNPWAQARDYRHAISYLSNQKEVDADRIGIWGSSFSGGEVLVLGAIDERVKAVVSNVPLAGWDGVDYSNTQSYFEDMRNSLLDESGNSLADKEVTSIGPMQLVKLTDTDEVPLPQPESSEWYLAQGGKPGSGWKNTATVVNALAENSLWDPAYATPYIKPPLMMLVATEDTLCPTAAAKDSFERACDPKELVLIDGHHFVNYSGEAFTQSSGAMCRFFKEHL